MPASGGKGKRPREPTDTRRVTHNQSEQRRARRINTYIEDLKQLLSASGRLGDKTDKGSTLEAAVVFISDALEAGDGGVSTPSAAAARPRSLPDPASGGAAVDYRRLFERSGVAQAIAGMDGSILDCNQRFTDISGYSRDEIRTRSIFNMTPAADLQRTFEIVSEMMEPSQQPSARRVEAKQFRKQCKMRGGLTAVDVTMTLVRDATGAPQHFVCAILPADKSLGDGELMGLLGGDAGVDGLDGPSAAKRAALGEADASTPATPGFLEGDDTGPAFASRGLSAPYLAVASSSSSAPSGAVPMAMPSGFAASSIAGRAGQDASSRFGRQSVGSALAARNRRVRDEARAADARGAVFGAAVTADAAAGFMRSGGFVDDRAMHEAEAARAARSRDGLTGRGSRQQAGPGFSAGPYGLHMPALNARGVGSTAGESDLGLGSSAAARVLPKGGRIATAGSSVASGASGRASATGRGDSGVAAAAMAGVPPEALVGAQGRGGFSVGSGHGPGGGMIGVGALSLASSAGGGYAGAPPPQPGFLMLGAGGLSVESEQRGADGPPRGDLSLASDALDGDDFAGPGPPRAGGDGPY